MLTEHINHSILTAYPEGFQAESALLLDTPSLGTCRHWRIETEDGVACLRRRSIDDTTLDRMQFQQAVLWLASCEGVDFVPLPCETTTHQGYVHFDGAYWELLPWFENTGPLDGSFEARSFRLASAAVSLAQFHSSVSTFPLPNFSISVSPGAKSLLAQWENWIAGRFAELHHVLQGKRGTSSTPAERHLVDEGLTLLNHALLHAGTAMTLLSRASRYPVPIQAVVGNCCRRHLRFDPDGLCGMIDFKEMTVDSVSWDIASLLGSMAEADASLRTFGLKAYQSVRSLSDYELFLIEAFDLPRMLLEGLDRLSRVFLSFQTFSAKQRDEIAQRLRTLNRRLANEKRNRRSA